MKKYNLSNIMKNAWTIRQDKSIDMAHALKQSWTIAKAHAVELQMFELAKASSARIINGKLAVSRYTPADVKAEVKANKDRISAYLSGDCFLFQVQLFDAPVDWVVMMKSDNPYVHFPPVEVFRGTAREVDDWMAANHRGQFIKHFPDGTSCQAKYVTAHC